MKLNYKRTVFVGFAFFLICAFWQAYDTLVPKILTDKFGMDQGWSGVIMAFDNVLALFLLPLFGSLSDKSRSKRGRRTPFIIIGTIVAAVMFVVLSYGDHMQLNNIKSITAGDEAALSVVFDSQEGKRLKTPDGEIFVLSDDESIEGALSKSEFISISLNTVDENGKASVNEDYNNFVIPARQAYAWQQTLTSPFTLGFFVVVLMIVLVSMASFRSPAVALMPDVTIKPLRSKANAVINLMGTAGGIAVLLLGIVLGTGKAENALMSYSLFFIIIAAIMLVSLAIFLISVNEPKFVKEMEAESAQYHIDETDNSDQTNGKRTLNKKELLSLILILVSVIFWYMGYNAVTSKYSVYAGKVLNLDYNLTLMIANGAALISYLPVGIISSKIGRRKTILAGVVMLGTAFFAASFMRAGSPVMLMNLLFALAGIGWATINVNSYPMVVELARGGNVGKYTGYYYAASMSAQALTPVLSGFLMNYKFTTLFPYAASFVALAFITMFFVKHGDNRPDVKKGLEIFDED